MLFVTTSTSDLVSLVRSILDVTAGSGLLISPLPTVQQLGLQKPQYRKTASYGHFGKFVRSAYLTLH